MSVIAPPRTLEQRMEALRVANATRQWRAGQKAQLRRQPAHVYVLLRPPHDPRAETWKVFDVLVATPKIGRVKAMRLLNAARISPVKTIGGLTDRAREALRVQLMQSGRLRDDPFAHDVRVVGERHP